MTSLICQLVMEGKRLKTSQKGLNPRVASIHTYIYIRRAFIPFGPFELQPLLDVTRCRDEKVLEPRFGQSAITIATHSVGPGQFADGALDAVALMHSFFRSLNALALCSIRRACSKS